MNGGHAPLAPSSAPVWGFCSGSVLATQQSPNIETQATREGNAAHWIGSECLAEWRHSNGRAAMCSEWVGKTAPNGVVIDKEMADAVQVYVSDVLHVANQHGALRGMVIEQAVSMPHIHPQNYGTLDCAIPVFEANTIYLWDYKHGHGAVEAEGNLQLIDYAAGLSQMFGIDGHADQSIKLVLRVVQPRCFDGRGPVKEWSGMLSDIRPYVNQLTAKANEAFTNPTLTSGPHCRYCPALLPCSASRNAAYRMFDYVESPFVIDDMTGPDLAVERSILEKGIKIAKARLDAVEEQIRHDVANGDSSSGLTLEATSGNLGWTVEFDQIIGLGSMFGLDLDKKQPLTPTQAIALAPPESREAFEKAVNSMAKRPSRGVKLVDIKNSRNALAFQKK